MRWARGVSTAAILAGAITVVLAPSSAEAESVLTDNACWLDANGRYANVPLTMGGTASAVGTEQIRLDSATLSATIPDVVFLELYTLGYYTAGSNFVGLTVSATVTATNTLEQQQVVQTASSRAVTIIDPDGVKGTGDEAADLDPPLSVDLPSSTWTPTGGPIEMRHVSSTIVTSHFFGPLTASLTCAPGTTPDRVKVEPIMPDAFESITPPTAPVCPPTTVVSGPGMTTDIDLSALCTDANDDIDPTTAEIVVAPTGGTASVSPAGILTYTNTDENVGADTLEVTIADSTGLVSERGEITFQVQTLRWMEQGGSSIALPEVALGAGPKVATSALNSVTITNHPVSGLGFTVSAYATDLRTRTAPTAPLDVDGDGESDTTVPSCGTDAGLARLCIPAANLGWAPHASVMTDLGLDPASVAAGAVSAATAEEWLDLLTRGTPPSGLDEPRELCSAPPAAAAGTFRCDADLFLGIPPSAGAGTYRGLIVLTII